MASFTILCYAKVNHGRGSGGSSVCYSDTPGMMLVDRYLLDENPNPNTNERRVTQDILGKYMGYTKATR